MPHSASPSYPASPTSPTAFLHLTSPPSTNSPAIAQQLAPPHTRSRSPLRPRVRSSSTAIDSTGALAAALAAGFPVAAALAISAAARSRTRPGLSPANRGLDTREVAVVQAVLAVLRDDDYFQRKAAASGAIEATGRLRDRTLTYGELDLRLLVRLLKIARVADGDVLLDVGSGVGRIVLTAAMLYPTQIAVATGVEILPELHNQAVAAEAALRQSLGADQDQLMAPSRFVHAEYAALDMADIDVAVCYATTWTSEGPVLTELSEKLGAELKPGARVVTVDKQLRTDGPGYLFELIGRTAGFNRDTAQSEGFVYKKLR